MNSFLGNLQELILCQEDRIEWNEYFMSIALLVSIRSPSKKLKVGSVVVLNNRIVSSGYNGFGAGVPHVSISKDGHEINTIHSEQNCIGDAAKRGVAIGGGTLYVTHFPCINCTKYIISSGIKKVIYLNDYKNDDIVPELLRLNCIEISKMDK